MPSSFLMIRRPPRSTLFPYTRSSDLGLLVHQQIGVGIEEADAAAYEAKWQEGGDRKSTRLNSSHSQISYAVFFFNDTATTEIYTLSLHTLFRSWPPCSPADRCRHRGS